MFVQAADEWRTHLYGSRPAPMLAPYSTPMHAPRLALMTGVILLALTSSVAADPVLGRLFFLPSERARIDAAIHSAKDPCTDEACLPGPAQRAMRSKKIVTAQASGTSSQSSLIAAPHDGINVRMDGLLIRVDIQQGGIVWLNGTRVMVSPKHYRDGGLLMRAGNDPASCVHPGQTYDLIAENLARNFLVRRISDARISNAHPQPIPYDPPRSHAEQTRLDMTVMP